MDVDQEDVELLGGILGPIGEIMVNRNEQAAFSSGKPCVLRIRSRGNDSRHIVAETF